MSIGSYLHVEGSIESELPVLALRGGYKGACIVQIELLERCHPFNVGEKLRSPEIKHGTLAETARSHGPVATPKSRDSVLRQSRV